MSIHSLRWQCYQPLFNFGLMSVMIALGMMSGVAQAQPSQKPLLSRDGGGVKPNIMLTMDDSGSMLFQHMPEEKIYVGAYSVSSPIGGNSVRMDPGDDQYLSYFFKGTIAAQRGTTNYLQKLMRSPDTNTIYYNPDVRYMPWALATYPLPAATSTNPAGRLKNSPVATAYRDPTDTSGGGTINLTNYRQVETTWCYRDSRTDCSSAKEYYDPGLYFRLKKDASGSYMDPTKAANYTEYSINVNASFPKVAARTDCSGAVGSTGCSQTEERQNYANWFTYYRTRNLLARGALVEAFAESTDTFRVGWARINDDTSTSIDGVSTKIIQAGVRDFTSSTKTALFDWLYALPADGGTPLRTALDAVGKYYSRSDSKGPWSDVPGTANTTVDKTCRRSYNILVTDGYWNDSVSTAGNSDNTNGTVITSTGRSYQYLATRPYKDDKSNTLADYAMAYWKKDLRTDLNNNVVPSAENPAFWQHMVNFTVGLGVRGTLNPDTDLPALTAGTKAWGTDEIDDLWHSAINSRGMFISAKDPSELASAVRDSVGVALKRELREAGVATASTVLQDGNRKYVPLYKTGDWNGDIQTYVLDANGQAGAQVWTAEAKVPAWASRNIITWSDDATTPGGVAFTYDTMGAINQTALAAPVTTPASTATDLVNFLRGDRSNEGDGKAFRARNGVLGDFINSNPVLVKDALNMGYSTLSSAQGGTTYDAFIASKKTRTATLFVGSNDGMLHAFKDTLGAVLADDGKEVFAYVPKTVVGNMQKLASKDYGTTALYHQYFVDGSLTEADAHVNAPGASTASWRNYLLGSLGAGGRAVYALDVTNTSSLGASAIRWELNGAANGDLGYVSAPIQVGVLPNNEWVAIFGNGKFSNSNNAVLFVVNLQTGVAQTLTVDATGSNGLGGVGVVRDGSGQITTLYAGDLKGNVWKMNYSASAASKFEVTDGTALFTATHADSVAQPITQPPQLYDHSLGGKIVVFGTGLLATESDADSTATQAIYGVWDKPTDTVTRPMTRSVLEPRALASYAGASGSTFYQLSGTAVDWTSQRGWVINLDTSPGLRVVYPPQKVNSKLTLISAVKPASSVVVCESALGSGTNLIVPIETGLNPTYNMFDTDGSGVVNASDAIVAGYGTNADGIDAVVTSTPVCSAGICTTKISIQNTTSQQTASIQDDDPNAGGSVTIKDRVWRRIINPPIK